MSEALVEKPTNGVENETKNASEETTKESIAPNRRSKRIRSRSKTPQLKNGSSPEKLDTTPEKTATNDKLEDGDKVKEKTVENGDKEKENLNEQVGNNAPEIQESSEEFLLTSESYMEPLILQSDEPCSELEFEESDKDSGKVSPIISRCATRRSQNRNIPTPKTPKLFDDPEKQDSEFEEIPLTPTVELNETDNSYNVSTNVQIGSELEFSEGESDFLSTLRNARSKSVISSRKSIREDIRKKSLKNSMQRANLSIPFFSYRDSVERAPSVKRKSRSETPEDRKRFKDDSGFVARITSPFTSLRSRFSNVPVGTSTPKLTSYRDHTNHLGGDLYDQMPRDQDDQIVENKWCNIM